MNHHHHTSLTLILPLLIACGGEDPFADPTDAADASTAYDGGSPTDAGSTDGASGADVETPHDVGDDERCTAPLVWGSCLNGAEQCRKETGSVVLYDYGPDVVLDGLCDDSFVAIAQLEAHNLVIEITYDDVHRLRLVIESVRGMDGALPEPPCTGQLLSGCQHKSGLLQFSHRVDGESLAELSYTAFKPELALWVSDTTFAPGSAIRAWVYASILVKTERGFVPRILTLDVSTFMK